MYQIKKFLFICVMLVLGYFFLRHVILHLIVMFFKVILCAIVFVLALKFLLPKDIKKEDNQ